MQKITTFLTFNDQALPAAELYVSIFREGRITSATPGPGGAVMVVGFELFGQSFMALNGGPTFSFAEGISLFVNCATQAEIDDYWAKLTADGGTEGRCGWCKDKFGVSWQIIPSALPRLLGSPQAVQAMMGMNKLDIAALEAAGR
ncbi:MAG: VOC family protein [Myxococcales bacterium]|nr:MAG: VOC family protein [Myxococcales bacterium]